MKTLTDTEKSLLATSVVVGNWYVTAKTLIAAAHLVEYGLAEADNDDIEGSLGIKPTQSGIDVARELNLVGPHGPETPWRKGLTYTDAGFAIRELA